MPRRFEVKVGSLPSGAVTHGSQITTSNTGYGAYFDSGLGRYVLLSDLTVTTGTHWISDYTTGGTGGTAQTPKVVSKRHFTGDILFDVDYVTVRACLFDNPPTGFVNGNHADGVLLDYCTVSPSTVRDDGMRFESWSANRCYFRGVSDGGKINGGGTAQNITECYMRVSMQSADDHNDTLQNVGGSGTVYVRRCNLSCVPETSIGGGSGGPNAVVMSADMTSGSVYRLEVIDSLLNGTGAVSTLRFYDGGLTTNITYLATGNLFVRSASNPVDRGSSNTTPQGQITWSNNRWSDDLSTIALS